VIFLKVEIKLEYLKRKTKVRRKKRLTSSKKNKIFKLIFRQGLSSSSSWYRRKRWKLLVVFNRFSSERRKRFHCSGFHWTKQRRRRSRIWHLPGKCLNSQMSAYRDTVGRLLERGSMHVPKWRLHGAADLLRAIQRQAVLRQCPGVNREALLNYRIPF